MPGVFAVHANLCARDAKVGPKGYLGAMWTGSGTVLTVSSRAMLAACERMGIDTGALLRTVGISRQTLEDPDARLEAV